MDDLTPENASDLSEARFHESVKWGEVLFARSIEPFALKGAALVATDAWLMQIQLREEGDWRRSGDVRASTAANGERGRVGRSLKMLRQDDRARQELEICWTSRHKATPPQKSGKGCVMLVVISCGNRIPGRWRTEWDFGGWKSFDDPHWSTALGTESNRICLLGG